jgi:hypothetical protein
MDQKVVKIDETILNFRNRRTNVFPVLCLLRIFISNEIFLINPHPEYVDFKLVLSSLSKPQWVWIP